MRKINSLLIILFLFVYLAACTPPTEKPIDNEKDEFGLEKSINKNKTTLFVSNFNGAFGERWLKAAIKRYEELHKDDVYEEGKKGVQIWIDNSKQVGSDILTIIDNSRADIFFTEFVFYSDFVSSGKLLDLTEIVTEKLVKYGESKSLLDKMTKEQIDYFQTSENKYYALPHYQAFRGLTYDVDLFEEEFLYLSANKNNGNDGFIVSLEDERSKGPDGISGTYDDGLPATYDEFFALCDRMKLLGITPMIWTGSNQVYFTEFLATLACDYEGLEQSMLNFTFNGEATNLVDKINSDGSVVYKSPTQITTNNGYLLSKQAGKYYSLAFAERLLDKSKRYIDLRSMGNLSHTDAQKEYIASRFVSSANTIGMILESSYWENEASDMGYFATMAKQYGEDKAGRYARRFGFMPFPKATEDKVGEGITVVDYLNSAAFIKANIENYKKDLALDFLQFLYTDESLQEFTLYTGCPKALNYTIEPIFDQLSFYTKSVFEIREKAAIVYPFSSKPIYRDQPSSFLITSFFNTVVNQGEGDTPFTFPSTAIYKYNVTALEYFNGLSIVNSQSNWETKFGKYFNKE
ncbi:MAG: ABC transporter substrate-binding protein [Bacilli bacterium]